MPFLWLLLHVGRNCRWRETSWTGFCCCWGQRSSSPDEWIPLTGDLSVRAGWLTAAWSSGPSLWAPELLVLRSESLVPPPPASCGTVTAARCLCGRLLDVQTLCSHIKNVVQLSLSNDHVLAHRAGLFQTIVSFFPPDGRVKSEGICCAQNSLWGE